MSRYSLVNKLIFPAPKASYHRETFPRGNLIWVPVVDMEALERPIKFVTRGENVKRKAIPCLFIQNVRAEFLAIFCHGNGEDLGGSFQFLAAALELLRQQGVHVSVLAVEYPGYGLHKGVASEKGVLDAAESAYYFARAELGWPVENIWMWGVSIGTGPATFIAARYEVGSLLLISPFESIRAIVRHHLGKTAQYLIADRFRNIRDIKEVACPVLIIHGEDDKLIPFAQSLALFDACDSHIRQMYVPEDVGHVNFDIQRDIVRPIVEFVGAMKAHRDELGITTRRTGIILPPVYCLKEPVLVRSKSLFQRMFAEKKEKEEEKEPCPSPPHVMVQKLVLMGFPEERVRSALFLTNNDMDNALELLLP